MPVGPGRYNGLVRATAGGAYEVEVHPADPSEPAAVVEATLRGRLKREERTGDAVVVGDRVEVERHEDGGHTIEAVAARETELARKAPGKGRRAKVLVANVDQMVAVFAVAHPSPRLRMLDRFLVLAESNGLEAVVVANKVDVGAPEELAAFEPYAMAGYPVLRTSAKRGDGIEELRERLRGRISVVAGPSGVGKSSLLNALDPELRLRTAEVSEAVDKGRHTTVGARLIPLATGGYVADTPGLRELGLWGVDPMDLDLCFPDFRPYLDACRFGRSCTHVHEPSCGVRGAVEAGTISSDRYASYAALLAGDDR